MVKFGEDQFKIVTCRRQTDRQTDKHRQTDKTGRITKSSILQVTNKQERRRAEHDTCKIAKTNLTLK